MASLVINKKKAKRLLTDKISEGNNIISKVANIHYHSEYTKMIEEHELWWNSVGELLKQIFDDERIAEKFQDIGFFVPTQKSLNQKINDFKVDIRNDLSKIQQIISDIQNDIYLRKNDFEFTYDGIINKLKGNKIIATILVLFLIFFGVSKIIESFVNTKKNINEIKNVFIAKDTAVVNNTDSIKKKMRNYQ